MLRRTHRPTEWLSIEVARAKQRVLRVLPVCSKVLKYKHAKANVRGARAADVRALFSAHNSVNISCTTHTLVNKSFKSNLGFNRRAYVVLEHSSVALCLGSAAEWQQL